jgi:predicted secreted protein
MDGFAGFVVFVLVWWTVLFCVLPIGTRPVAEADPEAGGWRGAPARPLIGRKLIATTLVSVVVWLLVFAVVESGIVSFRDGWWAYGGPGVSAPMPGASPGRAQN